MHRRFRTTLASLTLAGSILAGALPASAHTGHGEHDYASLNQAPVASSNANVAPLHGTLGTYSMSVGATAAAQQYFDEGINLTYGFNHAEAIRSFQDALTLDPACTMCAWGIALALGPNINAPLDPAAVPEANAAIDLAKRLAMRATQKERDFVDALATRYGPNAIEDRTQLDVAYANAMRELAKRYPDDLDAQTLFAESLMDLTPWNYWTKDGQPTEETHEILSVLEQVLARNPNHPGANHFYIHAIEASFTPEKALPSAERLETLVPGAGHLVHMPAHVYWRTGMYADAVRINEKAINVDKATIVRTPGDSSVHSFYALAYVPHNIHFVFAGAQMSGRGELALEAANKLVASIPEDAYAMAPGLEDFRPMPLFAMARFGNWDAIMAEPRPADTFQYTTGIWHWARGLAFVRQSQFGEAEQELRSLVAIAQTDAMRELTLASFPKASTLLELAGHVLEGEILAAQGSTDAAVEALEKAVKIQDDLSYIEPPAWYYPVRHNLGAVLVAAGRYSQAEDVYREDLRQFPENGWALFGLQQSLFGQIPAHNTMDLRYRYAADIQAAQDVWTRFTVAFKDADVALQSSRF
jgi:tetratricopeptide (TPR) repeat protein